MINVLRSAVLPTIASIESLSISSLIAIILMLRTSSCRTWASPSTSSEIYHSESVAMMQSLSRCQKDKSVLRNLSSKMKIPKSCTTPETPGTSEVLDTGWLNCVH